MPDNVLLQKGFEGICMSHRKCNETHSQFTPPNCGTPAHLRTSHTRTTKSHTHTHTQSNLWASVHLFCLYPQIQKCRGDLSSTVPLTHLLNLLKPLLKCSWEINSPFFPVSHTSASLKLHLLFFLLFSCLLEFLKTQICRSIQ